MAIVNGYATLAEAKAHLGIALTDTDDDATVERVVQDVSRAIDDYCSRRFWKNSVDETRVYTPEFEDMLFVDDTISVTTLKTDEDGDGVYEVTWAINTDYVLSPRNAPLWSTPAPYTRIVKARNGTHSFPIAADGVQIAGVFGYGAAIPGPVHEACLLQAAKIFKRKDSPLGVAGVGEFGVLTIKAKLDPDAQAILQPYMRVV